MSAKYDSGLEESLYQALKNGHFGDLPQVSGREAREDLLEGADHLYEQAKERLPLEAKISAVLSASGIRIYRGYRFGSEREEWMMSYCGDAWPTCCETEDESYEYAFEKYDPDSAELMTACGRVFGLDL